MSIRPILSLLTLIWVFGTTSVASDDLRDKELEDLPEALRSEIASILIAADVPGASIVVIEENQLRFQFHFGVRDREDDLPVSEKTAFRAGSISKSYTAIALMQLVESGDLDLNRPVSETLPALKIDNPWLGEDPIRVVHLLEHTAGLNDIAFRHYLIEGNNLSISNAVQLYSPYKARWRPGTRTSYSNAGPVIAGLILEKLSGQSFESYMADNVLGPMKMTTASWTKNTTIEGAISKSYSTDGLREEPFVEIVGKPSGSLNVTAVELARLPLLMLGRGMLEDVRVISEESVLRIERPRSSDASRFGLTLGYALGNNADLDSKTTFFGHNGSIDGFAATARYSPVIGAGYVIMINRPSQALTDVAKVIVRYLERDVSAPVILGVPIPETLKDELHSQFQSITPRRSFLAPLLGVSQWYGVQVNGDILRFKGTDWRHVGNGLFHAVGQSAPGLIAHGEHDKFRLQTGIATYRRVSAAEMWSKVIVLNLSGLIVALTLIHTPIWVTGAIRGKLITRGGAAPRAWPSLALFLAISAALGPLILFGSGDFNLLGKPTPVGWLVFSVTFIAPFVVLYAASVLRRRRVSFPVRALGIVQVATASIICLYLLHGGWFALKIWNA